MNTMESSTGGDSLRIAMPKVRCKFKCESVSKREGFNGAKFAYSAEFRAVYGGSPENDAFFLATPNGQLQVSSLREDSFQVGHDYYIDIIYAGSSLKPV